MKLTRGEHMRAEGAINALDVAGPRILELEAKVRRLQEQLDNLRPYSHETVNGLVKWRDDRIRELQEQVLVMKEALRAIRDNGMDAYMCMLAARVALATEPQP